MFVEILDDSHLLEVLCLIVVPGAYTVEVAVLCVNMEMLFVYSLESLDPSCQAESFHYNAGTYHLHSLLLSDIKT